MKGVLIVVQATASERNFKGIGSRGCIPRNHTSFYIMEYLNFKFENELEIRVIPFMDYEASWFVANDLFTALEINDTYQMIERLGDDEKRIEKIKEGNQLKDTCIISESGVYATIFSSVSPKAKDFRMWITSVVIPSIRKIAKYTTAQEKDRQAKMKMRTKNIDKVDNKIEEHKKEMRRLGGVKDKMQKELRQYINEDIDQLSIDFIL